MAAVQTEGASQTDLGSLEGSERIWKPSGFLLEIRIKDYQSLSVSDVHQRDVLQSNRKEISVCRPFKVSINKTLLTVLYKIYIYIQVVHTFIFFYNFNSFTFRNSVLFKINTKSLVTNGYSEEVVDNC